MYRVPSVEDAYLGMLVDIRIHVPLPSKPNTVTAL